MFRSCYRHIPFASPYRANFNTVRNSSRLRLQIPPQFPIVPCCPAPTCTCRPTPSDLDIEREQRLHGTRASYTEQVLISTGRDDWASKIEEEESAALVQNLKALFRSTGKLSDPYNNVMITNSSFPPSSPMPHKTASAFLLPSFRYIPHIPLEEKAIERFTRAFILPVKPHVKHEGLLTAAQEANITRNTHLQSEFRDVQSVDEILVLICGHGGRDARCGVMGPLLRAEFEDKLQMRGIRVVRDPPTLDSRTGEGLQLETEARVGLISHIGGHKWAGNVIIYIPPSMKQHPLAGKGIWYGRVATEHVEGIVQKTIIEGRVIQDMYRGGIEHGGRMLPWSGY